MRASASLSGTGERGGSAWPGPAASSITATASVTPRRRLMRASWRLRALIDSGERRLGSSVARSSFPSLARSLMGRRHGSVNSGGVQDPCAVQDAVTPSPFVLDADGVGALRSATLLGGFRMRHTPIQRLSRFRFRLSAMRSGVRILALLGIHVFWSTCQAADFACPAGDVACVIDAINTANANGQANTITLAAGT